jgi:hypothetical protein
MDGKITLMAWISIAIVASMVGCTWGIIKLWMFLRKTAIETPGEGVSIEYARYRSYALPIYIVGTVMLITGQDVIKLIAANVLTDVEFASFGFAVTLVYMLDRYLPMNLLVGMIRPLFMAARERDDYKLRLPIIAELILK